MQSMQEDMVKYVHTEPGRIARVILGGALIGMGIRRGGLMGVVMTVAGMEPILAALTRFSLLDYVARGTTSMQGMGPNTHHEQWQPTEEPAARIR